MWMVNLLICSISACFLFTNGQQGSGNEYTGDLRIGIKKRSSDCSTRATAGDTLRIHYVGKYYATNQVFDSSREKGAPLEFVLGESLTIKGLEKGLIGACEGEIRKLTMPSSLTMAEDPDTYRLIANIPQNVAVVFEIEVLEINPWEGEYNDETESVDDEL